MEKMHLAQLSVNPILTLEDLGLDRRADLDEASCGLARISEAQIVRWVQFPAGALFFTLAPGDPESGGIYVFDRRNGSFTGSTLRTRIGAVTALPNSKS